MRRDRLGLALKVLWWDDDVVELHVRCDNGSFSGEARCYESHSGLATLCDALRGFPGSTEDERSVEIGTFDTGCALGGFQLRFRCLDSIGHAVAMVRIRSPREPGERAAEETAEFSFPVEPAAIDRFLESLRRMPLATGATVELPCSEGARP